MARLKLKSMFCFYFLVVFCFISCKGELIKPEESIKESLRSQSQFENYGFGRSRQLQQNNARGFFRNVITKIELESFEVNRAKMQMIYDIVIEGGFMTTFGFPVFNNLFGTPDENLETISVFEDGKPLFNIGTDFDQINIFDIDVTFNLTKGRGVLSVTLNYFVDDLVCQLPDGDHVLMATWFNSITSTNTEFVEVDYVVPPKKSLLNNENEFSSEFTPKVSGATVEVVGGKQTIFIPYKPGQIGFGDGDGRSGRKDVFLRLNRQMDENVVVGKCILVEESSLGGVAALIVITLGCVGVWGCIGLVIQNVFLRNRGPQQLNHPNQNGNRLMRLFESRFGRDIVVEPTVYEQEGTTVRAQLEEDDPLELNDLAPTRTIEVRLPRQQIQQQEDEEEHSL